MAKYYAVLKGRENGVFRSWLEVKPLVENYSGAIHKSFKTLGEAENFLKTNDKSEGQKVITTPVRLVHPLPDQTQDLTELLDSNFELIDPDSELWNPLPDQAFERITKGLIIYTDGSCKDNYGGCGLVIIYQEKVLEEISIAMPERPTTNNRAELYALQLALEKIKFYYPHVLLKRGDEGLAEDDGLPIKVLIRSDSLYAIGAISEWSQQWKKQGWQRKKKKKILNLDLIQGILHLMDSMANNRLEIKFEHVKAHSGLAENERADQLANQGRINC